MQISSDPQFANLVLDEENITGMAFTMDTVDKNAIYYWRVKCLNDAGESNWSESYVFTTTAPNITVTSPNGGETFQRGLKYFIQWDDNVLEDVVIELYQNEESAGIIATTASDGVYKWDIDYTLETGSDYLIKIYSSDADTVCDMSDAVFSVIDTVSSYVEDDRNQVRTYDLQQNYPNPFNPSTTIQFELSKSGLVKLKIYNLLGEEVNTLINGRLQAGAYEAVWDAYGLPAGIYLCRLEAGEFVETKKLILHK